MKVLTSEQRKLVEEHMDFAERTAKRYARSWNIDNEDLVSVAYSALVYCALNYKPEKGKFITHSYLRVHGACRDWIEKETIHEGYNRASKKYVAIRMPMIIDENGELEHSPIYNDSIHEDLERANLIDKALSTITPRCKQLMTEIFKGQSPVEVAKKFGLTQSSVSNHRKVFVIKARKYFNVSVDY